MGDPGRQYREERQNKLAAQDAGVAPVPGRDTRVGAGNSSADGVAAQSLRSAIGALDQLEHKWIPELEAARKAKQSPQLITTVGAQSAMTRAREGIAQAETLRDRLTTGDVKELLRTATAERDKIAPRFNELIGGGDDVAHPGVANVPTVQRAAGTTPPPVAQAAPVNAVVPTTPVVTAAAYEPTWEDIQKAAAGDKTALAKLDIDWIDQCHALVVHGIEESFSHAAVANQFEIVRSRDQQLRKLAADKQKAQAKVISDEQTARKAAAPKGTKVDTSAKTIGADPAIQKAQQAIEDQYALDKTAREAELHKSIDTAKHGVGHGKIDEHAVDVPKDGVTNEEGRLLYRTNFMAWGIHVLGSASALKAHFLGMKTVPKLESTLLLEAKCADRLVEAVTWFEAKYPGNTFFRTDVGFGLRNAHNEKHTLSYLGHALGWSIDFQAIANPSFLNHEGVGNGVAGSVGRFMLKKWGNTDTSRAEATISLKLPSDAYKEIQHMGEDHAAGKDPSAKGQVILDAVKAYDDMTATSDRFKASQAANMTDLKAAKAAWIEIHGPLAVAKKTTKAALDKAQADAARAAAKDPAIKALTNKDEVKKAVEDFVKADSHVIEAATAVQANEQAIAKADKLVQDAMTKAFGPWVKQLQDEMKALEVPLPEADQKLAVDDLVLTNAITRIKPLTTVDQLTKILDDKKLGVYFDVEAMKKITDAAALRAAMIGRLELLRSKTKKWNDGELLLRRELITKLTTGAGVFGSTFKQGKNGWFIEGSVNAPPVMQLLEIGFARHDELADPAKDPKYLHEKKQVFNKEFFDCMMRFGFAPLASQEAFLDTMHFDFLEGHASTPKGDFHAGGNLGPKSKG